MTNAVYIVRKRDAIFLREHFESVVESKIEGTLVKTFPNKIQGMEKAEYKFMTEEMKLESGLIYGKMVKDQEKYPVVPRYTDELKE